MKIKISIFLLLVVTSYSFTQTLSQERKLFWINMLDSTFHVVDALDSIEQYRIVEALPKLENTIWNRNEVDQGLFIATIGYLKSPNTSVIAHKILDTLKLNPHRYDSVEYSIADTITLKKRITEALFYVNDFSTADYVFERVDSGDVDISILDQIETLASNPNISTDLAMRAKTELLLIINNKLKYDAHSRSKAIQIFAKKYGAEAFDILKEYHFDEQEIWLRYLALDLLQENNYPNFLSFLKEKISTQENRYIRDYYIDKIFFDYYTPENIKWLKDYMPFETDAKNRLHIKAILDFYCNIRFDISKPAEEIIDSLKNYTESSNELSWVRDDIYKTELISLLLTGKNYLLDKDSLTCAVQIKKYQTSIRQIHTDSVGSIPKYVSLDALKILNFYSNQILKKLPSPPTVRLINSQKRLLIGGSLQYYEGGWKDAIDNGDGTFSVDTKQKTVSLRMTYAYGSQTKTNVTIGTDTVVFQTVNVKVQLLNSMGSALDTGKVQYYAGAWREFGTTANGTASKELLPAEILFRVIYKSVIKEKTQDISKNNIVEFTF